MILETERLSLHDLTAQDAPFILALLNSRGFTENIGDRGVRDLEGARGYIGRQRENYATAGFGLWRVDVKATGEAAGICGLVKRDGLDDPDVGYAFLEPFWGRGYASEAAAATVVHARGALGIPTVVAIVKPENASSIAVLRKIGMKDLGLIRLPGHDEESAYFTT